MAITPVSTSQTGLASTGMVTRAEEKSFADGSGLSILLDTDAAVYDRSNKTGQGSATSGDTAAAGPMDTVTLGHMSLQAQARYSGLQSLIENLFKMQGMKKGESQGLSYDQIMAQNEGRLKSFYQNLKVDDATRLKAQQDVAEDGYWGVKQTSDRAVQFAIGLSGGDPSKLATLKAAIGKGYAQAEQAWGGALPGICQQTREATLKGLDDWAAGAAQSA